MLKKPRLRKNEGKAHFDKRVVAFDAQFLSIAELSREPTAEELKPGLPISVDDMRKSMLAEAGLTPRLLQKAVKRLDEQLSATTTKFFSKDGEVIEERNVIDHAARDKAIDKTLDLFGAKPARNDSKGGGDVQVNVIVAPWMKPRTTVEEVK